MNITRRAARLVTFGAVEENWSHELHLWERIRSARMAAGFPRAVDAAISLNVKPGTYRSWERPPEDAGREPPLTEIQRMARKFKVSWIWLASGEGDRRAGVVEDERVAEVARKSKQLDPERVDDAWTAVMGVLDAFSRKAG